MGRIRSDLFLYQRTNNVLTAENNVAAFAMRMIGCILVIAFLVAGGLIWRSLRETKPDVTVVGK